MGVSGQGCHPTDRIVNAVRRSLDEQDILPVGGISPADLETEEIVSREEGPAEVEVVTKPTGLDNAQLLPIGYVYPNPHQLRSSIEEEGLEELAASIGDIGILEPLLVYKKGRKRYLLIAGHRRLAAAQRAGLNSVPCIVVDLSEDEVLHYSLIENLQRADLTPFEEAFAIKHLIDQTGMTYREMAARIGKSAGFISDRLALLTLPKDIQEAVAEGKLSLRKALALSEIPVERVRLKLMEQGAGGGIEQFKQLIQREIDKRQRKRKPYEKWDLLPELREYARSREEVHIFKDRISLRYESPESLKQLLAELIDLLRESGVE